MADKITPGTFVSWGGGTGRVDLLVTKGLVPGVEGDVEGPAARVIVWKDGKPTGEKVATSATLTPIAPLDGAQQEDPTAALVALHGEHEEWREEHADGEAHLTGMAIKSAYDRGIASWPGGNATSLSPVEWALGRAAHLCKAARGEVEGTNDPDLLHWEHPLAVKRAEETGVVVVDAEQMQADLDGIMADAIVE